MTQPKKKSARNGEILGIYFGKAETDEFHEIHQEADKYRMQPSDYCRRLLRIARKVVNEDPVQLLNA